jgi:hypothetical protein
MVTLEPGCPCYHTQDVWQGHWCVLHALVRGAAGQPADCHHQLQVVIATVLVSFHTGNETVACNVSLRMPRPAGPVAHLHVCIMPADPPSLPECPATLWSGTSQRASVSRPPCQRLRLWMSTSTRYRNSKQEAMCNQTVFNTWDKGIHFIAEVAPIHGMSVCACAGQEFLVHCRLYITGGPPAVVLPLLPHTPPVQMATQRLKTQGEHSGFTHSCSYVHKTCMSITYQALH